MSRLTSRRDARSPGPGKRIREQALDGEISFLARCEEVAASRDRNQARAGAALVAGENPGDGEAQEAAFHLLAKKERAVLRQPLQTASSLIA